MGIKGNANHRLSDVGGIVAIGIIIIVNDSRSYQNSWIEAFFHGFSGLVAIANFVRIPGICKESEGKFAHKKKGGLSRWQHESPPRI